MVSIAQDRSPVICGSGATNTETAQTPKIRSALPRAVLRQNSELRPLRAGS